MLRVLSLCLAALALVASSVAGGQKPDPAKLSKEEETLLDLTNAVRKKHDLPPLKANAVLTQVARGHSANMAKHLKMAHVLDGKDPADRVKDAGYVYAVVGENVATARNRTMRDIFEKWMDSPDHRANILKKEYAEIGIGVFRPLPGEWYCTQVFGTPR